MLDRGKLLIGLIKEVSSQRILQCSDSAVGYAGLASRDDLLGRTSDEFWPDPSGHYQRDDFEVLASRRPKLGIRETVMISGDPLDVITDKTPWGENLIEVKVWDPMFSQRYRVAKVRTPLGWQPEDDDDPDFLWTFEDVVEYMRLPGTRSELMTRGEAIGLVYDLRNRALAAIKRDTWEGDGWYVPQAPASARKTPK